MNLTWRLSYSKDDAVVVKDKKNVIILKHRLYWVNIQPQHGWKKIVQLLTRCQQLYKCFNAVWLRSAQVTAWRVRGSSWSFLCGVCMFSLCSCGFHLFTVLLLRTFKSCHSTWIGPQKCPQVWVKVWLLYMLSWQSIFLFLMDEKITFYTFPWTNLCCSQLLTLPDSPKVPDWQQWVVTGW